MKTLAYEQLKQMKDRNENFLLINVLSREDFKKASIPGSTNIPLTERDFESQVERLAGSKERKIVVYCASTQCSTSRQGAEKLEKAGFVNVSAYEGGIKEWLEKGGNRQAASAA